jgi:hypothetical protein
VDHEEVEVIEGRAAQSYPYLARARLWQRLLTHGEHLGATVPVKVESTHGSSPRHEHPAEAGCSTAYCLRALAEAIQVVDHEGPLADEVLGAPVVLGADHEEVLAIVSRWRGQSEAGVLGL